MKTTRIAAILLGVAVVVMLTTLRWADPFLVRSMRETAFDQFQRISPRLHQAFPVRVADVDEASLAAYGQWPWPRTRIAELVNRLHELGASAIAFDVLFSEPDRLSPSVLMQDETFRSVLLSSGSLAAAQKLPDSDKLFAQTIEGKPVILGFAVTSEGTREKPSVKAGFAFTGESPLAAPPLFITTAPILPDLQMAAAGIGNISFDPSSTTVIRRIPMLLSDGQQLYPSLSLEALRVAQGASTYLIANAPEIAGSIGSIRVGDFSVETAATGAMWLHYAKDSRDRYVSVKRILEETEAPATRNLISGHIVLIGTSAAGLQDVRTTALGEVVPGVSIHAQAVEQILAGTFLSRPDWADGLEIAGIALLGLAVVLLAGFISPVMALIAGIVAAAGSVGGAWAAFQYEHFLLDPIFPAMSGLVALFTMIAFRFLVTDRERRTIRRAFSQYLAPSVLKRIESSRDALRLGGDERPLTILFMDIRNFTPISEGLRPTELVDFLNKLLNELSQPTINNEGTLDKFIGDSIMAFWNAPVEVAEHPQKAAKAALGMRAALKELNEQDAFQLKWRFGENAKVQIGIGINTGVACVGNMGAQTRFNYTAVGDAVNIAARVESATKHVGFDILVSEAAGSALPDMALLDAGMLELKGKTARLRVFALVGDKDVAQSPVFEELTKSHELLLRNLASGELASAKRALNNCRDRANQGGWGELAAFYDHIMERRADYVN
ncbi:MAG TPA: adenylate/guanylate cyclase domain-containing protein [Aestuariivirgaceae bacterium]